MYLSREKFWGAGFDKQEVTELDYDFFPGWNWYGRILTLIHLAAINHLIEILTSIALLRYSHAKDDKEEAKAMRIAPQLAMSKFDTDPKSDYDTPDDESH